MVSHSDGGCSPGWGDRCAAARSKRCRCRCGGANHGTHHEARGDLFDPQGEAFEFDPKVSPQVGAIYSLRRPCLGNEADTYGVCYEVYDPGGRPGYSVVFPNGRYDGFSPDELTDFLSPVGFSPAIAGYRFTNVMRLCRDFDRGVFAPVFAAAYEGDPDAVAF